MAMRRSANTPASVAGNHSMSAAHQRLLQSTPTSCKLFFCIEEDNLRLAHAVGVWLRTSCDRLQGARQRVCALPRLAARGALARVAVLRALRHVLGIATCLVPETQLALELRNNARRSILIRTHAAEHHLPIPEVEHRRAMAEHVLVGHGLPHDPKIHEAQRLGTPAGHCRANGIVVGLVDRDPRTRRVLEGGRGDHTAQNAGRLTRCTEGL
mmetsp:Transcript_72887/g.236835  ORF Transcript_72887/g.236835 Transcript_72887/m.236835 type:complete len:212 (-) Transcript_72887:2300-2935(-)